MLYEIVIGGIEISFLNVVFLEGYWILNKKNLEKIKGVEILSY